MTAFMISLRALVFFTVLTGLVYPLLVLVMGQAAFSHQARGSLITVGGKVLGSELIGQNFDQPQYFWPRPSATGPKPYNAEASSGSNFGPLHPDLKKPVAGMPRDMWTTSGSGLDPHISPEAARYQAARVSEARKIGLSVVNQLIGRYTERRQFGILGEERVNVLQLNLALDGNLLN
ncbi:MAG: potassium-transporting ATPase subunit KdpC [Acidobacteria bacterium]|nr:potassium-transporting ATPase subunit KdpC [Acidobacteriota bacterium]